MDESNEPFSILFLSQYFPPETGAPPTRVDALTKRWADAGHDVTVLTSAPDYPEGEIYDGYENAWLQREERDGVTVYMTKTLPASTEGFVRRAMKFLWFMIVSVVVGLRVSKPDVVIATSPQPFTGISGWLIARIRRAKFVFEIRDLWPESIEELSSLDDPVLLSSLNIIVKFIYSQADKIAAVSRGFESALTAKGVEYKDIWFHPNGVEPTFFEHGGDQWKIDRELRQTLENHFVISHVGTIGRSHGLEVVIDAAERLQNKSGYDDVLFVLVGYGAKKEKLERLVETRGINNVLFVDRRPMSEVPDFLELTDVSLVHVKDKGLTRASMPFKMFEAMASGNPIALGVYGESERIIEEATAGIVFEPENAVQFVESIQQLYDEPDRRERLGENGATYVREHFSWDSIADDYRRNLESLARE
ncbi:glycosyltransferase family 4 protein [Halorussus halobius]|uniref:glycosyltransferase family 4 protein n=1 Tax=Halorussus halobius TaxID=1710537 RepID=UPI001091DA6B|nr:glycosyltransferase family 4 protein [Halorussus halobius]